MPTRAWYLFRLREFGNETFRKGHFSLLCDRVAARDRCICHYTDINYNLPDDTEVIPHRTENRRPINRCFGNY